MSLITAARQTMPTAQTVRATSSRRGAAVAVLVLMLAALNVVVLSSVVGTGNDTAVAAMRAESTRAFYAAESGAVTIARLSSSGLALPAAGSTLAVGPNARATYVTVPALGAPGELAVNGVSGSSVRRIRVRLD